MCVWVCRWVTVWVWLHAWIRLWCSDLTNWNLRFRNKIFYVVLGMIWVIKTQVIAK